MPKEFPHRIRYQGSTWTLQAVDSITGSGFYTEYLAPGHFAGKAFTLEEALYRQDSAGFRLPADKLEEILDRLKAGEGWEPIEKDILAHRIPIGDGNE